MEQLSRHGTFVGQHICTPKLGVAVHINAFNFPVWGMLEKLAPTLLAGVPAIVKPATASCYLTEACFGMMIESGIFSDFASTSSSLQSSSFHPSSLSVSHQTCHRDRQHQQSGKKKKKHKKSKYRDQDGKRTKKRF